MTDQELIAKLLADETDLSDCAADRIEELVKERDEAQINHLAWKLEAEATQAGLNKAVEALRETTQMLSQCTFTIIRMKGQYFERHEVVDKANAVLAELEKTE